nr:hypothetical protein ICEMyc226_00225 [Mycolicibacterium sp.]
MNSPPSNMRRKPICETEGVTVIDEAGSQDTTKPGAEPPPGLVWLAKRRCDTIDSTLIARSDGVAIWQTEKTSSRDLPRWRPPFGMTPSGLFRGFPIERLHDVLEHGLDVAPQSAFFATRYPDKAWEYPVGRNLAAMLILDSAQSAPSWVTKPAAADDSWQPDKASYPNEYVDSGRLVHTRFARDRGSRHFTYESMYGFWVPGDARAALLGILLGGPQDTMRVLLESLQGSGSYGLELVP